MRYIRAKVISDYIKYREDLIKENEKRLKRNIRIEAWHLIPMVETEIAESKINIACLKGMLKHDSVEIKSKKR